MEERKTAAAETTTDVLTDDAKVLRNSESAKESKVNPQSTNRISMIGDELARCTNKLTELSAQNDMSKDVESVFESLGYTDLKQFERLLEFLDKGAFNDLDTSITSPKFRFNICGVDCVPSGEVIGVGGKPGAGKSTSLALFIGVLLGDTSFAGIRCLTPCKKVLWIDTEKGDYSCKQKMAIFRRIANMSDNIPLETHGVTFRQMRGERLLDRITFIDCLFAMGNYDCVVIDGIYDLTDDANDNCAPVIELLQRIVQNGTSVFAMLHTNKNDDNFRYAMGTELTRIATTIFKIDFDKTSGIHSITHDKSNDSALAPQVIFKFAEDGSICVPDISLVREKEKADKESIKSDKLRSVFAIIFKEHNEGINRNELARLVGKGYGYRIDREGKCKSGQSRIDDGIKDGIICKHDDDGKYYLKS